MPMLPNYREPIAGTLLINPVWMDYLRNLGTSGDTTVIQKQIVQLQQEVADIQQGAQQLPVSINPGVGLEVYTPDGRQFRVQVSAPADGKQYAMQDGAWTEVQTSSGSLLPMVTGEIASGQPVFVYADDGSLISTEVF